MKTRKKIAYKCYDIDDSLFHAVDMHRDEPQSEWLIQSNQEFFDHEIKEIREDKFDIVIITSFSHRQDHAVDYDAARNDSKRSSMVSFLIIQAYFQIQLGNSVTVVIDLLLTADIFGKLSAGRSYRSMMRCYFPQQQANVQSKPAKIKHAVNITEQFKTSLSYVRIQRAACFYPDDDITIFFYDDDSDILSHCYKTYSLKRHRFVVRNTTLILRQHPRMTGLNSFQEDPIIGESPFLDSRYDLSLVYMCAHLQIPLNFSIRAQVKLDWEIKNAASLKVYYKKARYYLADRKPVMDNFRKYTDGRGNLDDFDSIRCNEITKLSSARKITENRAFITARDLLDELNIPLDEVLGEELVVQLPPSEERINLDEFFSFYDLDAKGYFKKSNLESDLQKERAEITVEDIIYHAMKDPLNSDGTGGNRTAKILNKTFQLDVGQRYLKYTRPQNPAHYQLAKQFYDACMIIRYKEQYLLEGFERHYKDAKATQCYSRSKNTQPNRHYGLVWYLNHAKSNWYNKLFGTFGIYGFYSGKRSYTLFKNQFTVDAREDSSTETMAQNLVQKTFGYRGR